MVVRSHTFVACMVSSSSLSHVEVKLEFRVRYVAESIVLRILDETSCFRGRWEGMGKAIPAMAAWRRQPAGEGDVSRVAASVFWSTLFSTHYLENVDACSNAPLCPRPSSR